MELTGILHAHSTYSYDGKLSLRELREECRARGLSFACMTEHADELTSERAAAFVAECASLSDQDFLFIPGFEVPYPPRGTTPGHAAHVLMIGCRAFHGQWAPTIAELMPWVESSAFVVLAHPVRNAFIVDDALAPVLHGVEVWNQQYDGKRVPRTRSLKLFASLRERYPSLVATGGIDLHRLEHFGAPLITLTPDVCTETAIVEKLRTGAFTISGMRGLLFGTMPNTEELIRTHQIESAISVGIIEAGKRVNAMLARFGIRLPKRLRERIRRRL